MQLWYMPEVQCHRVMMLKERMLEYISPAAQMNDETECVYVMLGICIVVLVGMQ